MMSITIIQTDKIIRFVCKIKEVIYMITRQIRQICTADYRLVLNK